MLVENDPKEKGLSRKEIASLAKEIRPIKKLGGDFFFIKVDDCFHDAFSYRPQLGDKAPPLEILAEIRTRHTYGHLNEFFFASVSEVLEQIPRDLLQETVAFETFPPTELELSCDREAIDAFRDGDHLARTVLYRLASV